MTDLRAPCGELGRLAELAAMAVDERDAALVDGRLAVALAALPAHRATSDIDRLAAAARDVTRPLHRRVAVLAALHEAFRQNLVSTEPRFDNVQGDDMT